MLTKRLPGDREDGGDIGESGVHFPLCTGETADLADVLRTRVNSQQCSSIYEDWRSKIVEDIENQTVRQ